MLQALRANKARATISRTMTIPAPVGGINAKDGLAEMPIGDAITLTNFFPEASRVTLRNGYSSYATGLSSAVETLMVYHALNGTEKLFAGNNHAIYNASSAGTVTSVYSTSITNNRWQYANFATSAGLFIVAVNGSDTALKYDGTNWGVDTITGVTSSTLINVFAHKERLWFIQTNTLDAWYLASSSISGAATKFPLGAVATKGGHLLAGANFSLSDTGDGMDDLFMVVTSNGEAIVYSGTDPNSDFSLLGVYPIGKPMGNRCLIRYGGDVNIITTNGVESMRQIISFDQTRRDRTAITYKINDAFNSDVQSYSGNFGWEGTIYPKGRFALINVPISVGSSQRQWVQNLITGQWCKFTNLNASTWAVYNDNLYFGDNSGVIYKADTGSLDGTSAIEGELKTAFTYCGKPGQLKQFNFIRPTFLTSGVPTIKADIDTDFTDTAPSGTLTTAASTGTSGSWGSGTWGTSTWGGVGNLQTSWLSVGRIGSAVAVHMTVSAYGVGVQMHSVDIGFETGDIF